MAVVLLNSASHNETGKKNCAYKNTDAKGNLNTKAAHSV